MKCERCGKTLVGKQERWCSPKCSKLGLKALYRKRNRKKVNAYNRKYRKNSIDGSPSNNGIIGSFLERNRRCARCGSQPVNVCHIKPRWAGGRNKDNLISLCNKCHYQFDNLLRDFWRRKSNGDGLL